jgi:hypothetical protein
VREGGFLREAGSDVGGVGRWPGWRGGRGGGRGRGRVVIGVAWGETPRRGFFRRFALVWGPGRVSGGAAGKLSCQRGNLSEGAAVGEVGAVGGDEAAGFARRLIVLEVMISAAGTGAGAGAGAAAEGRGSSLGAGRREARVRRRVSRLGWLWLRRSGKALIPD